MIARILKIAVFFIILITVVWLSAYFTLTFIIKSEDTVVVPELVGKDVVYALEILTDLGLNTKVKGSEYDSQVPTNHVIFQEPEPGTEIKKGRDIRIIISKGARTILMPNLKGLALQQARIILEENDLCRGAISSTYIANVEKDDIIEQAPAPGAMVQRETCVDLLVSLGVRPQAYQMPDLKELSLDEAILLIETSNLVIGEIKSFYQQDNPKNVVIRQEPLSGHRVIEGTPVNIMVNRKPGRKGQGHLNGAKGVGLFRYRLQNGFLKRRIRVCLNSFGVANDLFDDFMKPGAEIWCLIPNIDATVLLYEDDKLVKTQVFDAW